MKSSFVEFPSRALFGLLVLHAIGTYSSMAGMNLTAVLLLMFVALLQWGRLDFGRTLRAQFASGPLPGISLALSIVLLASLIWTSIFPLQYGGRSARVSWPDDALKLWYFALPFAWAAAIRALDDSRRHRLLLAWLGAAFPLGLLAVIQFFTGFPRPQPIPGMPGRFHAILFFGHHLSTGSIFIFPAFAALALLAAGLRRRRRSRGSAMAEPSTRHLAIYALGALGALLCLFFSWSRMAWLALPVGLLLVAQPWLSRKERAAVALSVVVGAAGLLQLEAVRARLGQAMGIRTRFELWAANWEFFKARPLLGVGWRKTFDTMIPYFDARYPTAEHRPFVGHAHNNLLEMLAGTGLAGTVLWLAWNFAVLVLAWRVFGGFRRAGEGSRDWREERRSALAWGILTAWIMLHLNGLTQVNFWEGKVQHQMMLSVAWLLALLPLSDAGESSRVAKSGRAT